MNRVSGTGILASLSLVMSVVALSVAIRSCEIQEESAEVQRAQFESSIPADITIWAGKSPDSDYSHALGIKNDGAVDLCQVIVSDEVFIIRNEDFAVSAYMWHSPVGKANRLPVGESIQLYDKHIEPEVLRALLEDGGVPQGISEAFVSITVRGRRVSDRKRFRFVRYYRLDASGGIVEPLDTAGSLYKPYADAMVEWKDWQDAIED